MTMILQGPSMKAVNSAKQQAAFSLSQLIGFNCVKSTKGSGCRSTRHLKERETPLPLFLGMTVHARTRKRDLVDTLFNLGLSVNYTRVLEMSVSSLQTRMWSAHSSSEMVFSRHRR